MDLTNMAGRVLVPRLLGPHDAMFLGAPNREVMPCQGQQFCYPECTLEVATNKRVLPGQHIHQPSFNVTPRRRIHFAPLILTL